MRSLARSQVTPAKSVRAAQAVLQKALDNRKQAKEDAKEDCEAEGDEYESAATSSDAKPKSKCTPTPKTKKAALKKPAGLDAALPYPGTAKHPPQCINNFSIYTDVKNRCWRVKPRGERVDKPFSFKVRDPTDVWQDVLRHRNR